MSRNEEREQPRAKTNLIHSKSIGSLQNQAGSIGALKALFESKAATPDKPKSSLRATNSPSSHKVTDITQVVKGEALPPAEKPKTQSPAPVKGAKDDRVSQKVN